MTEQEIKDIQQQLNEEKYYLSENCGTDMSGCMKWCQGCAFQNVPFKTCNINHGSRTANSVCAKNYAKIKETNNTNGKKRGRPRKNKTECSNM